MKHITATYIESGTFVAGEEDVFNAEIERDEAVVVLKANEYKSLEDLSVENALLRQSKENWECACKANDGVVDKLKTENEKMRLALIDCGVWMAAQIYSQDSRKWKLEIFSEEGLDELRRCEKNVRIALGVSHE